MKATNNADVSVLERQGGGMKWEEEHHHQQHQQQLSFLGENELNMLSALAPGAQQFQSLIGNDSWSFNGLVNRAVKPDPGLHNGWPHLGNGYGNVNEIELLNNNAISRTTRKQGEEILAGQNSSAFEREGLKKRKAETTNNQQVCEII